MARSLDCDDVGHDRGQVAVDAPPQIRDIVAEGNNRRIHGAPKEGGGRVGQIATVLEMQAQRWSDNPRDLSDPLFAFLLDAPEYRASGVSAAHSSSCLVHH